jgi:hypothetical protein
VGFHSADDGIACIGGIDSARSPVIQMRPYQALAASDIVKFVLEERPQMWQKHGYSDPL